MQSIFRYPGGKTRRSIQDWIKDHRPSGTREYREPFVGGGGIFFSLSPVELEHRWISDLHEGLIEVYKALVERPREFIDKCRKIEPQKPGEPQTSAGVKDGKPQNARLKAVFDRLRLNIKTDQALRFFFVNRTVFGGRVNYDRPSRLYFSKPEGWDIVASDRLERAAECMKGVKVTCGDFEPVFDAPGKGVWIYADPPYWRDTKLLSTSKLYQHGFTEEDHQRLAHAVRRCKHKVSLSYDDTPEVRELYPESDFCLVPAKWAYNGSTKDTKDRGKELLILNYDQPGLRFAPGISVRPLTPPEQEELAAYEEVISCGLQNFIEIGESLRCIHNKILYRGTHPRFEDYCRERWRIGWQHAYRLIAAAEIVSAIKQTSPIGDTIPDRESLCRELGKLRSGDGGIDHAKVTAVWSKVVERSKTEGSPITSSLVRSEVAPLLDLQEPSATRAEGRLDRLLRELLNLHAGELNWLLEQLQAAQSVNHAS